ncbi:MAG: LytTR family DNA-binding domain-containing protein [Lachnospiraceae bacterium]
MVHTARQDFDSIHKMNYWSEQLPKNSFFQTHRSFIVNFEHIVDFDHSIIHLSNPQITAYLAPRKYQFSLKMLIYYIWKVLGKNKWNISFYFFLVFLQKQLYYGNTHPTFLPSLMAVK